MGTLRAIAYAKAALGGLAAVGSKKVRQQIKERIDKLADSPKPPGCAKVRGLANGSVYEVYRVRQGDYRVIYAIHTDGEIVVLDIGHRKDVYR